jgi:hypothetical protein
MRWGESTAHPLPQSVRWVTQSIWRGFFVNYDLSCGETVPAVTALGKWALRKLGKNLCDRGQEREGNHSVASTPGADKPIAFTRVSGYAALRRPATAPSGSVRHLRHWSDVVMGHHRVQVRNRAEGRMGQPRRSPKRIVAGEVGLGRANLARTRALVAALDLEAHSLSSGQRLETERAGKRGAMEEVLLSVLAGNEPEAAFGDDPFDGTNHCVAPMPPVNANSSSVRSRRK